jgi:ABC-type branched-chain amino acid transport systems, periplasmic component
MNLRHTARVIGAGAVALSLVLATAACSRDAGGSTGGDGDVITGPGFDGETITLGVLGVTSGALAEPASLVLTGTQAYFDQVNAAGGIAGKYQVELNVRDTAYDPAKAIQEYNATKDDVAAYAQIFGTAMVNAILPDLNADQIINIPSSADGTLFKQPSVVIVNTPTEIIGVNAIEYAISQPGNEDKRVCYIAMEGALGVSVKDAINFAADELGANLGVQLTVPIEGDYTPQIQELRRDNCEIVMTKGSGVVLTKLLSTAVQVDYAPLWLAETGDFIGSMVEFPDVDYIENNLLFASAGTVYGDDSAEAMDDLIAAHEAYAADTPPVFLHLLGYASGMALGQILEQAAANGDLSREGLWNAMNSLDELTFGGLISPITWGEPDDRRPATNYNILSVDVDSDGGLAMKEFALDGKASRVIEFHVAN